VTVTVRSVRPTIRLLERATLKTYGAREVKAAWPWCLACLWTFQGRVQTCGSRCSRRLAWGMSSLQMARSIGERAFTGTKK